MKYQVLLILYTSFSLIILANGKIDPSFKASDGRVLTKFGSFGDNARTVLVQPDGKIVVIGKGTAINSFGDFSIARYNSDGSFDLTFGTNGKTSTTFGIQDSLSRAAVFQSDGKIVVVGQARANNTSGDDFGIIRYNPNGTLDNSFGNAGKVFTSFTDTSIDYANDVAIKSDGKILVSGNSSAGGFALAQYNIDGSLDSAFGIGGKVTVSIGNIGNNNNALAIQDDGKIFLAGSITNSVGIPSETQYQVGLVKLNSDGSLDSSFDADGKVSTSFGSFVICNDIQVKPNGKIVAVGSVETNSSTGLDFALLQYNTDGSLDAQFNGGGKVATTIGNFDDKIWSVVTQPNGSLVVAGETRINSDDTDISLVRYDANGNLDPTFGNNGKVITSVALQDSAQTIALQTDGKIIVAGSAAPLAASSLMSVVRYNPNGLIDQSFGTGIAGRTNTVVKGIIDEANAVAIQNNGKIVSAGRSRVTNRYVFSVIRQNPDGTLDTAFGVNGIVTTKIGIGDTDSEARAVAIQSDGKIIVAGRIYDANNVNQSLYYFSLVRYNQNGSLDTTFDGDGIKIITAANEDNQAYAVALQPDGKILVGGYNDVISGSSTNNDGSVVRLNSDGSLDTSFDGDGIVTTDLGSFSDVFYSIKVQTDGKILVGGTGSNNFNQDFVVVRYNLDGSLDTTFGIGGKSFFGISSDIDDLSSIAIQQDNKIIAVGTSRVGSQSSFSIFRLLADGNLDIAFGTNGKVITPIGTIAYRATSLVIQNDNKIIASGFSNIIGNYNLGFVRYHPNGSLDQSFGLNGIKTISYNSFGNTMERITASALQSDGKLIAVGSLRDKVALGIANDRRDYLTVRLLTGNQPVIDFDGDSKTDISVFRPSNGEWYYLRSGNGVVNGATFGSSTDKPAPADYTGDGKTDIAFFRPSTGEWFIIRSEDSSYFAFPFGVSGDIPTPGDFDGDGKADQAVFRPSNGVWYINKSGGGVTISTFGTNGDRPVVADYDGDGKADIAIFRPSVGEWYYIRSTDSQVRGNQFGSSTDRPVQGDYTGDGKADFAFFRPSTGSWFVLRSEDSSFFASPFGVSTDTPTPGDYDGDGKFDQAVFRPSNGVWYLNRSTAGIQIQQFGVGTDLPVPSYYLQ